jgi:hypothetical protein
MRTLGLLLILSLSFSSCKLRKNSQENENGSQSPSTQTLTGERFESLYFTAYGFNENSQYVSEDLDPVSAPYRPEARLNSVEDVKSSIETFANKAAILSLGADFAYLNEAGLLTSYSKGTLLTENCYLSLLDPSLNFLIYVDPSVDLEDFLGLSPSLDIMGAGEVCTYPDGAILQMNNNSVYGLEIPTLLNLLVFMRHNGFVFSNDEASSQNGLGLFRWFFDLLADLTG